LKIRDIRKRFIRSITYQASLNPPKSSSKIVQWRPRLKKRKQKCFLFLFQIIAIKRKPESIKPYNSDYGKNLILITHSISKSNENEELVNPYSLKRKKVRIVVVSWLFFHFIALILSKLNIWFFDYSYSDSLFETNSKIWPFVDFISKHYGSIESHEIFNGIFYFYDFSEFILYNLIFGFIWFLLHENKR
jgi:hypothetical protein